MYDERTPVLIAGGGLVGLSTALFLGQHGVRPLLVERHFGTANHARTPGYNPRTMELFRSCGIEDAIRDADDWPVERTGILWVETLAGEEIGWLDPPEFKADLSAFAEVSPAGWAVCRQDRLEPVLRTHAERLGGDLRFGTRMVSFEPDPDGVTAVIEDRESEARRTVRADYLVDAEGTKSEIRRLLGIEHAGVGVLDRRVSIWFRADLSQARRGRGIVLCMVRNAEVTGALRVTTGDQAALTVSYDPGKGEGPEDFTPERCVELIRAAVGIPDLRVSVEMVSPWDLAAGVAHRYRQGRVFLVGDSAHIMPPAGAYGANTGIQESHNLAWKLAFVLNGVADEVLLDSYQAERRPVAELTMHETVARWRSWFAAGPNPGTEAAPVRLADDLALMFGYGYRSAAVLAEQDTRPTRAGRDVEDVTAELTDPREPTGGPGVRAPHVWFDDGTSRVSTTDLCRSAFVLLTGVPGEAWQQAARRLRERLGVPLDCYRIGQGGDLRDIEGRWPDTFRIGEGGAVLLRPDGFVAWRERDGGAAGSPERVLERVLLRLLRPDGDTS
ncbi:FAD-dependent oxidoreductase [Amycolatopsis cihanbeyliensis]|uniref:Putative polyketide hydroxylase/tetracenomycin A2 monooxygenase-dioxygenase n=1 Tax=Amycolatopsis cihanbeyliensis TaxID=1128664 RepID=A0A542DS92_AMYCI|nr:FAD-dependent oxidoreductase [Amycolatopsis cihanbeyliensis]TQJ05874.1 putative polyketide hydroxylase/tetracenomycin A2 monooxygenase-dioxygenase [Amycolatopsis cihanbeyliensis]